MTPRVGTEAVTNRDDDLRDAHRRAFDKIREAVNSTEREALVSTAVTELIDACEDYLNTRIW